MGGFNQVTIGGNLTRGTDHRQLPTGNSVTRVSVAVNERYTGKDGDSEKVGYFDLQAWGELADTVAEGGKGQGIIGVGRLVNESWDDKDGTKRYGTKVELERAHFVSSGPTKSNSTAKPKQAETKHKRPLDEEFPPEENLPF